MSGAKAREEIDVEALLCRTYRERAVHRLQTASGCDRALARLVGLGMPSTGGGGFSTADKVDTSSYAANMAARTREAMNRLAGASDVLLEVHDVVLGLPDFFVELTGGPEFLVWDEGSALLRGQRIERGAEGATIVPVRRRGGRGKGADDLLPIGPRRRVSRLVTSNLMIRHGADATRPVVAPLTIVGTRPVYRGARKEAIGVEALYETSPELVALDRATHASWHAGLGLIAEALRDLAGYTVTGPRAQAEPWESAGLTLPSHLPPVVLEDGPEEAAPEPVRPRRGRRREIDNTRAWQGEKV